MFCHTGTMYLRWRLERHEFHHGKHTWEPNDHNALRDKHMFNPEILKRSGPYEAQEGCLSLSGVRPAKRWKSIKVRWQNEAFQERQKTFTGWTAQIIQHEIDHCEGIII